jgi:hypothetical protein
VVDKVRVVVPPGTRLDVEVEAVNNGIAKGTGLVGIGPCRGGRAECTPQPVTEVLGNLFRWQVVVCRRSSSSERQQDLLAVLLAELDGVSNTGAVLQYVAGTVSAVRQVIVTPASIS